MPIPGFGEEELKSEAGGPPADPSLTVDDIEKFTVAALLTVAAAINTKADTTADDFLK